MIVERNGYRISVDNPHPGVWLAVDDNTYDCDCDENGFFSLGPVGQGETQEEAILDLLERLEDEE